VGYKHDKPANPSAPFWRKQLPVPADATKGGKSAFAREEMRITATVFAVITLIGATLAPALAQNKPVPDELEGWWVPPSARGATCRTPDVEKQIGFFIWEIAQDQKELQPLQAQADSVRAPMTKSLMSGKATGTDVNQEVNSATGYLQYLDGKIHVLEDRIGRAQRAKQVCRARNTRPKRRRLSSPQRPRVRRQTSLSRLS
jgi:hypothetical protein